MNTQTKIEIVRDINAAFADFGLRVSAYLDPVGDYQSIPVKMWGASRMGNEFYEGRDVSCSREDADTIRVEEEGYYQRKNNKPFIVADFKNMKLTITQNRPGLNNQTIPIKEGMDLGLIMIRAIKRWIDAKPVLFTAEEVKAAFARHGLDVAQGDHGDFMMVENDIALGIHKPLGGIEGQWKLNLSSIIFEDRKIHRTFEFISDLDLAVKRLKHHLGLARKEGAKPEYYQSRDW